MLFLEIDKLESFGSHFEIMRFVEIETLQFDSTRPYLKLSYLKSSKHKGRFHGGHVLFSEIET